MHMYIVYVNIYIFVYIIKYHCILYTLIYYVDIKFIVHALNHNFTMH